MAKTRSGRYKSGGSFVERWRQSREQRAKEKKLKEKNPKKYKRQKAIAKASSDGRITKKEAQKLAKKGISLAAIRNRNISEFRSAQKSASKANRNMNRDRRTYDYAMPSFQPLKITGGAERVFGGQRRKTAGGTAPRAAGGGGGGQPSTQPTNQYQSQIEDILGGELDQQITTPAFQDPYADALASLQQTIAGIQMPDYGAELEAMRAEQDRYMQELAARQAEAERQRELAFRTAQENVARGGLTPDFRIGSRSSRDRMGTSGFRRRRRKPLASVVAQGITPTAQTIANKVANTLPIRGISI